MTVATLATATSAENRKAVIAGHRDLADWCYRQQLGAVLLSHRGCYDHVPRRAQNPRDGVRAIALTGLSAELLIVVFLRIRCRSRSFDLGELRCKANQRISRCDVCDHRAYPDEAHRRA